MGYKISYANLTDKKTAALADCRKYLGKRFKHVTSLLADITDADQFAMLCGIAGVGGYWPICALYDHVHGAGTYDAILAACDESEEEEA